MNGESHTTSYWKYLCSIIGLSDKNINTHSYLLGELYSQLFCAFCEDDQNRIQDALDLRRDYCLENGLVFSIFSANLGPCNILEVLVAFCIRIENDIARDPRNDLNPGKWFWIMMSNLEVDDQSDIHYQDGYVEDILSQFLERKFMPDGRGGLFRICNPRFDAREMSMSEQMFAYINENPKLIG